MNTSTRSRLVSALAVAAVSIAALGAVAGAWLARDAAPAPLDARGGMQAQRPAADQPVRVVKAPPATEARQQPASCRDCAPAPLLRDRL